MSWIYFKYNNLTLFISNITCVTWFECRAKSEFDYLNKCYKTRKIWKEFATYFSLSNHQSAFICSFFPGAYYCCLWMAMVNAVHSISRINRVPSMNFSCLPNAINQLLLFLHMKSGWPVEVRQRCHIRLFGSRTLGWAMTSGIGK